MKDLKQGSTPSDEVFRDTRWKRIIRNVLFALLILYLCCFGSCTKDEPLTVQNPLGTMEFAFEQDPDTGCTEVTLTVPTQTNIFRLDVEFFEAGSNVALQPPKKELDTIIGDDFIYKLKYDFLIGQKNYEIKATAMAEKYENGQRDGFETKEQTFFFETQRVLSSHVRIRPVENANINGVHTVPVGAMYIIFDGFVSPKYEVRDPLGYGITHEELPNTSGLDDEVHLRVTIPALVWNQLSDAQRNGYFYLMTESLCDEEINYAFPIIINVQNVNSGT